MTHPLPPADDRGASAVEYSLLIGAIAAVVVAAVVALGQTALATYDTYQECYEQGPAADC